MARILVIEDDEAVRRLLCLLLQREGFEVTEAENGEMGLLRFREDRTDLVITDIIMPDKEGLETIAALRQLAPGTKIIAISGGGRLGPDGYLSAAKTMGADYCFRKPFERRELLDAVHSLLAHPV